MEKRAHMGPPPQWPSHPPHVLTGESLREPPPPGKALAGRWGCSVKGTAALPSQAGQEREWAKSPQNCHFQCQPERSLRCYRMSPCDFTKLSSLEQRAGGDLE